MEGNTSQGSELNLKDTELRLGLPGTDEVEKEEVCAARNNKRALTDTGKEHGSHGSEGGSDVCRGHRETAAPATKQQIIGWPPIRSYRKNTLLPKKAAEVEGPGIFVKVSMDGAPYLRKIDLKVYQGYPELLKALENMFKIKIGEYSERDGYNGSDYEPTYEDKEGDWMLVGDVPWEMFMSSCKRLRIMKGSEASGLRGGV